MVKTMLDTRYTISLFAIGIILRYYYPELPFSFTPLSFTTYIATLIVLSSLLYICRHTRYRYLIAGCLAISVGISYANWRISLQQTDTDVLPSGRHSLRGHIISLPEYKEKIVRFRFAPQDSKVCLLISTTKAQHYPPFRPGQYWALTINIPRSQRYLNPGGIDFSHWLSVQGVQAQAYLESAHLLAPAHDVAYIDQLRAHLQSKIENTLGHTSQANIISALTIGDQSRITETQWQRFRQTGIVHLISISGIHVTMLAGLITLICRRMFYAIPWLIKKMPPHKPALIAGLIGALAYAILAGFSIPTQRTIFMLFASVCAVLSSKNLSAIQIWLSALFAVLILEPMAVRFIGFWL